MHNSISESISSLNVPEMCFTGAILRNTHLLDAYPVIKDSRQKESSRHTRTHEANYCK